MTVYIYWVSERKRHSVFPSLHLDLSRAQKRMNI